MNSPVITVTFNPAIDETITLDALRPGEVHRARSVRFDAGGKGVMVAGCLADWGQPVIATGLLGSDNTALFNGLFAAKGIEDRFIRHPGQTRTNIKLLDPHATTDINLPGADIPVALTRQVRETVLRYADAKTLVVLSGSLPAGFPAQTYAELIGALAEHGIRTVLDTSGAPLGAALQARVPSVIKPNREELEAWAGHALPTRGDLIRTAQDLLARGVELVAISMGAEGALFISPTAALHASLPPLQPMSTVGAGDAMVAGIVAALAERATLEHIARLGSAFAHSKLGQIGPNLGPRDQVQHLAAQVQLQLER